MRVAESTIRDSVGSELDMLTIRRRVAQIKNKWTPEVSQARAAEGARRRRELDAMVAQLLGDLRDHRPEQNFDAHGLSLIG